MRISSKALALSVILLAVPLGPPSFPAPAPIEEAKRLEARVRGLIKARRYAEALPLAKRALEIRERALGAEHPSLLLFINRLIFIHSTQKNSKEAGALRARARKAQKRITARRRAVRAKTKEANRLITQAIRHHRAGRYRDAEPLFLRALAIVEKALGPEHPDVATGLNNLASVLQAQGLFKEAEPLYKRTLSIVEKSVGPDHPRIVRILRKLAGVYEKLGKKEEEAGFLERAEAMKKRLTENR